MENFYPHKPISLINLEDAKIQCRNVGDLFDVECSVPGTVLSIYHGDRINAGVHAVRRRAIFISLFGTIVLNGLIKLKKCTHRTMVKNPFKFIVHLITVELDKAWDERKTLYVSLEWMNDFSLVSSFRLIVV